MMFLLFFLMFISQLCNFEDLLISKIYLSRLSGSNMEYLVQFNKDRIVSHWVQDKLLIKVKNFQLKLEEFNSKDLDFKFYIKGNDVSNVRVVSHMENGSQVMFLCRLDYENENVFFWEMKDENINEPLIDEYEKNIVMIQENNNPSINEQILSKTFNQNEMDRIDFLYKSHLNNNNTILYSENQYKLKQKILLFLEELENTSEWKGPHIVFTNNIFEWEEIIHKYFKLKPITYCNGEMIQQTLFKIKDDKKVYLFNILLIRFDDYFKDLIFFKGFNFQYSIVDDDNIFKKDNIYHIIQSLKKIVITKTLIKENIEQSFKFISPALFNNCSSKGLKKDKISQYLYIQNNIYNDNIKVIFIQLSQHQKEISNLIQSEKIKSKFKSDLLLKNCNHPFLINENLNFLVHGKQNQEVFIKFSSKFIFLDRIIPELKKNGNFVLIFSHFIENLNLLEEYCRKQKYRFEVIKNYLSEEEKSKIESKLFGTNYIDICLILISDDLSYLGKVFNHQNAKNFIFDYKNDNSGFLNLFQENSISQIICYNTIESELLFEKQKKKIDIYSKMLGNINTTKIQTPPELIYHKNVNFKSIDELICKSSTTIQYDKIINTNIVFIERNQITQINLEQTNYLFFKKLFSKLGLYGYGEWENISRSFGNKFSVCKIAKLSQLLIIYVLNLVYANFEVFKYPFILYQLSNDIPSFNILITMYDNKNELYDFFPDEYLSFINVEYKNDFFKKNCYSFLLKIEYLLIISKWSDLFQMNDFPFHLINMDNINKEKQQNYVKDLLNKKIQPLFKENIYKDYKKIIKIMKGQLAQVNYFKYKLYDYWTIYEIREIIKLISNYGFSVLKFDDKTLQFKTGIFNKDSDEIKFFLVKFLEILEGIKEQSNNLDYLDIPDEITKMNLAPFKIQSVISIDQKHIKKMFKGILYTIMIKKSMNYLRSPVKIDKKENILSKLKKIEFFGLEILKDPLKKTYPKDFFSFLPDFCYEQTYDENFHGYVNSKISLLKFNEKRFLDIPPKTGYPSNYKYQVIGVN